MSIHLLYCVMLEKEQDSEMNLLSFAVIKCMRPSNQHIINVMLLLFDNCIANKNGYTQTTDIHNGSKCLFISFVVLPDAIRINPSYCHFHFLPHKIDVIRAQRKSCSSFMQMWMCWRKRFTAKMQITLETDAKPDEKRRLEEREANVDAIKLLAKCNLRQSQENNRKFSP